MSDSTIAKASDSTRFCLLKAAKKLFATKGFSGASVKEICSLAKVNICSVSYHFGGKEELYRSCILPFAESESTYMLSHLDEPKSMDEFEGHIRFIVLGILSAAEKHPYIFKILNREMESNQKVIIEILEKTFHKVILRLRQHIVLGKQKGWVNKNISETVATLSLFGGVQHIIRTQDIQKKLLKVSLKDKEYKEEVVKNIVHIFIKGIQAEGNV